MTDLRTLPIRLQPLPGEAPDSWLEALAFRMRMPAGVLPRSVGLRRRAYLESSEGFGSDWMIRRQGAAHRPGNGAGQLAQIASSG